MFSVLNSRILVKIYFIVASVSTLKLFIVFLDVLFSEFKAFIVFLAQEIVNVSCFRFLSFIWGFDVFVLSGVNVWRRGFLKNSN